VSGADGVVAPAAGRLPSGLLRDTPGLERLAKRAPFRRPQVVVTTGTAPVALSAREQEGIDADCRGLWRSAQRRRVAAGVETLGFDPNHFSNHGS